MNANVYNAQYCEVASAYNNPISLTAGGQDLYNYAQSNSWTTLSYGAYNALYKLGDYTPVWATSRYTANNIEAPYPSDVPGTGLVYLIWYNNLEDYDVVYLG